MNIKTKKGSPKASKETPKNFWIFKLLAAIATFLMINLFMSFPYSMLEAGIRALFTKDQFWIFSIIFLVFGFLAYLIYNASYKLQMKMIDGKMLEGLMRQQYKEVDKQTNKKIQDFESFIKGMIFVAAIIILFLVIFESSFIFDFITEPLKLSSWVYPLNFLIFVIHSWIKYKQSN